MTHNKVFCHYCRTATASRLVSFSKKNKDAFVSVGCDNWKKALKRFREHEVCHMHTESYMKLKSLQQKSIANQLPTSYRVPKVFIIMMAIAVLEPPLI